MQLAVARSALLGPLSFVAAAADARSPTPILSHVLLNAAKGKLSMLCSDTGIVARATSDVTRLDADGSLAVDARRLGDLVRAIPENETLEFALKDAMLNIRAGRSRFRLPTLPAADYPKLVAEKDQRVSITLSAKRLAELIDQVARAMATNDVRLFLNGLYLKLAQGHLLLVATDGHRLSVAREPVNGSEALPEVSLTVPHKVAVQGRKLLPRGAGDATLTLGPRDVQFALPDGQLLFGKALDGQFPDWQRAVPTHQDKAIVTAAQLRSAMGMIGAVLDAGDGKTGASLHGVEVVFGQGQMTVRAGENGTCEIAAEGSGTAEHALTFNAAYLRDAVDSLGSVEKVCFGYTAGQYGSITVQPEGGDYPLSVVMPLRV